jgi:hypothetical protein
LHRRDHRDRLYLDEILRDDLMMDAKDDRCQVGYLMDDLMMDDLMMDDLMMDDLIRPCLVDRYSLSSSLPSRNHNKEIK